MGGRKSINEKLRAFKKSLSVKFRLTKVILFGSRARGKTGKDKDIDILIVSPDFRGLDFFQRGARMYDYWELDYPVDFICYTPEEFEKRKKQIGIVRQAIKEGIEIK